MIGKRARLLATAVAVSAGLLLSAGAANAATTANRDTSPAAQSIRTVPSAGGVNIHVTGALPAGVSTSTITHQPTRVKINATTSCYYGVYTRVNWYESGYLQWWFAMNTNFCYNGSTVTYHSTSISQDHGTSWSYSPGPTVFNCYSLNGHPNCSGNHEHNESSYFWTKYYVMVWVTIDQYEQYNGAWHWTWNTHSI
jgi:hypothetical protein